jgi:hypothetical protein
MIPSNGVQENEYVILWMKNSDPVFIHEVYGVKKYNVQFSRIVV